MPIPKPNKGESEKDFIGRCAAIMAEKDPDKDNDQRVAICYEAWRSKGVEEPGFSLPLPSDLGLTPQGSLTEKCKAWSEEARAAAAEARRGRGKGGGGKGGDSTSGNVKYPSGITEEVGSWLNSAGTGTPRQKVSAWAIDELERKNSSMSDFYAGAFGDHRNTLKGDEDKRPKVDAGKIESIAARMLSASGDEAGAKVFQSGARMDTDSVTDATIAKWRNSLK